MAPSCDTLPSKCPQLQRSASPKVTPPPRKMAQNNDWLKGGHRAPALVSQLGITLSSKDLCWTSCGQVQLHCMLASPTGQPAFLSSLQVFPKRCSSKPAHSLPSQSPSAGNLTYGKQSPSLKEFLPQLQSQCPSMSKVIAS